MSHTLGIIDQDTLLRDHTLTQVLNKIKEKVMKGHVVEIKTLSNSVESKSNSFISSMSSSALKDKIPITMPLTWKTDQEPLNTLTNRETHVLNGSFNNQLLGPKDLIVSRPEVLDQDIESESSNQSLYSDEEPQNIEFISQRLDDVEKQKNNIDQKQVSEVIKQVIKQLNQLYSQTILLIFRTQNQRDFLQKYCYLAVKCICLQAMTMKKMGNFSEAQRMLENCHKKFEIHDPQLMGMILVETGKLNLLLHQFDKAQDNFYKALLLFEKLNWKIDMAFVLTHLARLYGIMKNYEDAKKLSYESISIYKTFLNPFDEKVADAYLVLAETYYLCKEMDLAFEFVEQAINIKYSKYNTTKHPCFINDYNLLGIIYANFEDYKQSLSYFKEALSCTDQQNICRGQILNNLGVIYQSQNQIEKAEKCFQAAEQTFSVILPKNHSLSTKLQLNKILLQDY